MCSITSIESHHHLSNISETRKGDGTVPHPVILLTSVGEVYYDSTFTITRRRKETHPNLITSYIFGERAKEEGTADKKNLQPLLFSAFFTEVKSYSARWHTSEFHCRVGW